MDPLLFRRGRVVRRRSAGERRQEEARGKEARRALIAIIEGEDEVSREIAQDALDELEFTSGSSMLLVDIGLESEEEEILAEELEDEDQEVEDDDNPPDLLDDGGLRPRRKL